MPEAPGPLLAAKQAIPSRRADWVPRERLSARLRANGDTRLTVVVAPAGWGKTTLLAQWARDPAESRRVAWVSLDESDDEPVRFWSYVLGALAASGTGLGAGALSALGAPGLDPVDLAIPTLLNELIATPARQVLVLDDYHLLADARVHEGVEFLLAYLPPALHLVIAGRSEPPLPVARLRARGELTEIRTDDLRFRPSEAVALLANTGVRTDPATAAGLLDRTEGWAVGLRLGALTVREAPASTAAVAMIRGDSRHLLDYFVAEVLDRLAPRHRDLLVRSSVLAELTGPLCDAVLERAGCAADLRSLDRAEVFVGSVDAEHRWYRCHRLFREALRRELDAAHPDLAPGLHRRAAEWFLAHGRVEDAVGSYLAAGDGQSAAVHLRSSARWFFEAGAAASYLRLGERLAPLLDPPDPRIYLNMVFAATLCGRFDRVPDWLAATEPLITPGSPPLPGWCSLRAGYLSRRAIYGYTGPGDLAAGLADATLAAELETDPSLPGYAAARGAVGAMLMADGRFAAAAEVLTEAWRCPGLAQLPTFILLQAAGVLSLCLLRAGRTAEAARLLDEVVARVEAAEARWGDAAGAAVVHVRLARGRLEYQTGELRSAQVSLRRAAELAVIWGQGTVLVAALASLADAELAGGDRGAARDAVVRARETADSEPVYPFAIHELEAAEARLGRGPIRAARRAGHLAEDLTDRETAILHALRGSATQREIAAALFLSINTVKGYTRSLYRKLGVVNRREAVERARTLELI
jgi:LuxR family maltose regulon positive regulatory protein